MNFPETVPPEKGLMTHLDELQKISQQFILERTRVHAQFYLSNFPMLRNTCSVQETMQYFDRDLQRCFMLFADMAKGETAMESKTVERSVEFNVFASWTDHLKYRLKEGRLAWLPEKIKRRINIRYQKVVKTVSVTVPVSMTRACPHVTDDWKDRPNLHVAFLKPIEWGKSGLFIEDALRLNGAWNPLEPS